MKRILLSAVAAMTFAAPLAAPAFADQARGYQQSDRRDNDRNDQSDRNDRDNNRYDRNDRDGRGYSQSTRHGNRDWRDTRRDARFDVNVHNGYYVNNRWHSGPPSASAYRTRGFQLGYKPWAKGQRLGYFNNQYREVDYRQRNLRAPPRGYHYVQDDNGGIILAAIATGLIAAIIASN